MTTIEYNAKTNKEIGEQTFYYYLASIVQNYIDIIFYKILPKLLYVN